jgi:NAD-dependent SIR2 family protein deacetylase
MLLTLTHPLPLTVSGIPDEKLVEAHGSFATASCHLCYTPFPAQEAKVNQDKRSPAHAKQRDGNNKPPVCNTDEYGLDSGFALKNIQDIQMQELNSLK